MHDVDSTATTYIAEQRLGSEETDYAPDVPLSTRLRLEVERLRS